MALASASVRSAQASSAAGRAVLVVDLAAGKDIGAPHEVRVEVALQHADLERGAVVDEGVAHEHDGGGVACRHRARRAGQGARLGGDMVPGY